MTLMKRPRFVRWGARIDVAPEWIWLALFGLALWPSWWWMGRRMGDGSDDPLGLLALAALGALVWRQRARLTVAPRLGWLAGALALALAATVGVSLLPPLAAALLAVLAVACALAAWLPHGVPRWPVFGLSVLALPLLASLQFYAGYPLRVLTAEASRWLLAPAFAVERTGASLRVDGLLVLVDAPCSGVQMAWLGYFTACVAALHARRADASFLARLPAVGLLVLTGNVLRNTVLVALAASAARSGSAPPAWLHEAVGLAALAAVCGAVAWVMTARSRALAPRIETWGARDAAS
jgi:exosortase/archaeosortase family protein